MTTVACLRCERLVELVGISQHDGSDVDLEEVDLDTKEPTAMLTALCADCLGADAALFLKNSRSRVAKYLTDAEDALAGMKWVADGPLKDNADVQRDIRAMEARVETMRAQFAALMTVTEDDVITGPLDEGDE